MVPFKIKIGVALALLLLCSNSLFAVSADSRSSVFQDGPLNCYICDGVTECAQSKGIIRKCESNDDQTCVTVFDATGAVTQRACSDSIQEYSSYCSTSPERCPECSSSGCNVATSLDDYLECVYCDSAIDENCILQPNSVTTKTTCYQACMTSLYPSSGSTGNYNYRLVRSCLYDRDLDDREACLEGTDSKCIACNEPSCNLDTLPETRHTCFKCDGDCEDPTIEECLVYKEQEQCYMLFDANVNDLVQLGCSSDFDNDTAVLELVKEKSLLLCDGNNCNGFQNFPSPYSCTSCTSDSDEACASNPASALAYEHCAVFPYTQCFERVTSSSGGITERGCLSSLENEEFYECLTGSDANCNVCTGDNCNKEIIPADRPKCQRCSSADDGNCKSAPNSLEACPLYLESDSCVSLYQDGVTTRGCLSEFMCDGTSTSCQICKGDGCNTLNVQRRSEEVYGAFQELPLSCYNCTGQECLSGLGTATKCSGNPNQDCLTVFDSSGQVVRRGCEIEVLSQYQTTCESQPDLCFACKSNDCNTVSNSKSYQLCLYCDTSLDPNCLFNPSAVTTTRKCVEGCVSALHARKTDISLFDLVRTCVEDIESEDRDTCTSANNCVKCSGSNKCNTDVLPAQGRLTCYHCEGTDCDTPVTRECLAYGASDQCYIYFDSTTYSAVRSGCKSEYEQYQIDAEIKQFFLCDGANCNSYDNLPDARVCYVCDSSTNENCAVNPTAIQTSERCQIHPYTNCFTRVRSDGQTQRGCLYSLNNNDFVSCQEDATGTRCLVCDETGCNNKLFPSDRQQCYRCNSADSTSCETWSNSLSPELCPLYQADDTCVTKYVSGVTYRGCGSELSCTGADHTTCLACDGNNCNTADLNVNDIGKPGLFQGLPLNCYNCIGSECAGSSLGVVKKCEGNIEQTCTVAFAADGSVAARGCSASVNEECGQSGNTCYECKSNGCNTARQQSDYIDCLYCDGASDSTGTCVTNPSALTHSRPCLKSCMTALYPRTEDENPAYELIRTCLDDMDLDDREICEAGQNEKCTACSAENCNTAQIGERISCWHCDGDDCQSPTAQTCNAVMENDQCYVQFDETRSIVRMGCKSQYDTPEIKLLVTAKRLWLCDGENCNTFDNLPTSQQCSICSSRTDASCAIAPESVGASTNCAILPYTQCYSRLLESGHTERGCLSSLEEDQFYDCLYGLNTTECLICVGDKCNNQIHPADRQSCQVCNSISDDSCTTSPQSEQVCLLYAADQQCVTHIDEYGNTVRGCSQDLTCDVNDSANCNICDESNCNNFNLKRKADGKPGVWQTLPLNCHSCSGEEDCLIDFAVQTCSETEYCMTVFNLDGKVIRRGCSDTVESEQSSYCDVNSDNCHNCNSNLCNVAGYQSDYVDCIYCDSEKSPQCVSDPTTINFKRKCYGQCMTALYQRSGSSAYELSRSCLDDKDSADQDQCSSGSDDFCVACSGSNCNTARLPETRLSCYVCSGENCEDPEVQTCSSYLPDDKCFIRFDEMNDVAQMGCVSSLSDGYTNDNFASVYTCSGDNCNSFTAIPTPNDCAQCNSFDDPQCANDPLHTPDVVQCTTLPYTECYTRVFSDGSTRRGCASSLTKTQLQSCVSGNAADCTVCHGDRCNIEIFPADRRRCHRCNSKEDPSCEDAPDAEDVCPFYSTSEYCTSKIVKGFTYRGCSSDFICDDTDKQYCRLCSDEDNCNTVNLALTQIGYPGKWQDPPINCYTCLGTAECAVGSILRKCEGTKLQNCGTVFAADGSVLQRGCSNLIYENEYASYCDSNPTLCKFCKSNGCNNNNPLTEYNECIFCDGADNTDCVSSVSAITRTRSCHQKCLTGLYARADEDNPAYELSRGCLDDLDLDDREECENGKKDNCIACIGNSCNNDLVPETRLQCNVCDGEEDCKNPSSRECTAYRANDQCFTQFDHSNPLYEYFNTVVRMGCASDFDNTELEAKRRVLFLCNENNCNVEQNYPTSQSCNICKSENNPRCATDPSSIGVGAVCDELPFTSCYTRVDEDTGATWRGCLSDLEDEAFDDCRNGDSGQCAVCTSNDCNAEVFPEDRRRCLRCDSADNADCEDSPRQYEAICPVYKTDDRCVTKLEGTRTLRGCASDFTCDSNSTNTCRICDSDNCNAVNLMSGYVGEPGKWQDLPLNCYTCEGTTCASGLGTLHRCETNNLQNCMTVFAADGSVERRGCSDAVEEEYGTYCDENSNNCITCKSSGCNNAQSLDNFIDCYFCDSADSSTCSVNFATTRTRKCKSSCMVALYPRSSAEDTAYEMSRSCLDDMDLDDREACSAGQIEFCEACVSSRCNTMSLPAERHECYKCAGDDCENPQTQQCNAYLPQDQCYMLFDNTNDIVAMGCRSEYETDALTELVKQQKMLVCDGVNCNAPSIVPMPKECVVCSSDTDPRCATNPNLIEETTRCVALPYTDCYTRVNENGITQRGCLSSLEDDTFYGCLTESDGLCETCDTAKCNGIDVFPSSRLKCHQCSSDSDSSCSTAPTSNKVCPIYKANDACVSNLYNGVTTRGCASSLRCDDPSDKHSCRTCSTSGCNTVNLEKVSEQGEPGLWQGVPINCYACVGEEDCTSKGVLNACRNNDFQNCMSVFNAAGQVIQRGCSDTVEAANTEYCATNPERCLACNSNGCNVATSLTDYVECVACDTDSNGDCVNAVSTVTKTRQCYKHCMTAMYPLNEEENPSYGLSRSCYDDMDLDDRDACEAGDKEYCEVCSTSKCNVNAMPAETRLSCYLCTDDGCQDPKTASCPTYRADDKCYTRYDEQRSIVAMGCRSEFSNEDADYLVRQKRLLLCDGNDCNGFESLPSSHVCMLCSSRTDESCATAPNTVTSQTTCAVMPYTECYARVLSDGATERGCLSNLYGDEFVGCLNGTSSSCQSCTGDKCNEDIYPSGRTSCHICDSSTDASCEASANHLSICPLYDEAETCVTKYLNGVTYRGCGSSLVCDSTNPKTCTKCTGDGCNTVNLAVKQDDNHGRWQDLPLECLTCTEEECDSGTTIPSLTCENNNEQDCITVFDNSGKVVRRGCEDAVQEDYGTHCDTNANSCFNCKSNNCNTATAINDFVDCVYCDSFSDLNCIWNPTSTTLNTRKCQGSCMSALYVSVDNATNPIYGLVRTCLNDKEVEDQSSCNADSNCKACTGARCNVDDLPDDRHSCYICEGENCEDPESKLCPLYKQDDQCYMWFDESNSVTEMGCLSSFRNQPLESILKTKRVLVCDGENCNSFDKIPSVQKCAVCDSGDNVYCATNAFEIGTIVDCSDMPYTNCYSRLADNGTTSRGCLSNLPEDDFLACLLGNDENCAICTGDACNREVFPTDRLQCYTCTSEDDNACEADPTRLLACPLVSDTEACVTSLTNITTLRGCSSELYCDKSDSSTCRSCYGTACNSIDLRNKYDDGYHGVWQTLPLRCHTCEGEHCYTSLGPATACTKNIYQDCMTVFDTDGEVVRRGCEDDVEDYMDRYCRQNPQLCVKCKSNDCNAAWSLDEYVTCAYCNSTSNTPCATNPEVANLPTRSCYKECMVAMKKSDVIRSCLDDKELYSQPVCRINESGKECASCSTEMCNIFVYPSDRLRCYNCLNSDCAVAQSEYCADYEEEDYCFAKYANGKIDLMGCASSQNSSDIQQWEQSNELYRCEGNECNELSRLPTDGQCISCDSSKTPNCAQNPSAVQTTENCLAPSSECLTSINTSGHTVRGCANSLTQSEQDSCAGAGTCAVCSGDKCNNEIFPTNRRKCYVCNSVADEKCAKEPDSNSLVVCPVYAANDRCVTKNTDNYIERGCSSEFTCDTSDEDHCQICDTNGCNTADLTDAAVLATGSLLLTMLLAFVATVALRRH